MLLVEPYYGGSHAAWADGYARYSHHQVELLTLPAQSWKWRMQGGAVTMARLLREKSSSSPPEIIVATDMINLATLRALSQDVISSAKVILYFHENQLTYPQNSRQGHGWRYGFINYVSALAADWVLFNSAYHRNVFLDTLPPMLKHFGDYNEFQTVAEIAAKSSVLSLGLDLRRYDAYTNTKDTDAPPLILWNHRWEADKYPAGFFRALYSLLDREVPFRVALVGENFRRNPTEFEVAREKLGSRVVAYGYIERFEDYARLLWEADYVVSTAYQDFFGIAVSEAVYCGCVPLLPRRLNYPALVPAEYHDACLYKGETLLPLLLDHLQGRLTVDQSVLRQHIARYDWSRMAPVYDDVFTRLAQGLSANPDN